MSQSSSVMERKHTEHGSEEDEPRALGLLEEVCQEGKYITVSNLSKLIGIKPLEIYEMLKRDTISAVIIDHRILVKNPLYGIL